MNDKEKAFLTEKFEAMNKLVFGDSEFLDQSQDLRRKVMALCVEVRKSEREIKKKFKKRQAILIGTLQRGFVAIIRGERAVFPEEDGA